MLALAYLLGQSAQTTLEKNEYWLVAVSVVATFIALIALLGVFVMLRRQPPIEREIDDRIQKALAQAEERWRLRADADRDEMLRLNQERRVTVANLFQRLEDYRKETKDDINGIAQSLQSIFGEINHSIGRLEGQISKQ